MTEYEEAVAIAHKVLDDTGRDPDSDLSMMSRQFLRLVEGEPVGHCEICNGSGMPNGVSGYPCPGCSPEAVRRRTDLDRLTAGRRCPKCDGLMHHERLRGWTCQAGCPR